MLTRTFLQKNARELLAGKTLEDAGVRIWARGRDIFANGRKIALINEGGIIRCVNKDGRII